MSAAKDDRRQAGLGLGVGTHGEAVRRQPFDLRVAEAVIGETWFVRFLSSLFTRLLLALLGRMQPRCQQLVRLTPLQV